MSPTLENLSSPEIISATAPLIGAQFRMILGEQYLSPRSEVPQNIAPDQIPSFGNRNYGVFERASTRSRIASTDAGSPDYDFEAKKSDWVNNTTQTLNSHGFQQTLTSLDPFFSKMGLQLETTTTGKKISADGVKHMYEVFFQNTAGRPSATYVSGQKKFINSDVKLFVSRVISAHVVNNQINIAELASKMKDYKILAGMFGKDVQNTIVQLIQAEVSLATDKQGFINRAMAIQNGHPRAGYQNLTQEEKVMLEYLADERLTINVQSNTPANPQSANPAPNTPAPIAPTVPPPPVTITSGEVNGRTSPIVIVDTFPETTGKDSSEIRQEMPFKNAEVAVEFCNNLRARVKREGEKIIYANGSRFRDPKTNIDVTASSPVEVDNGWFDNGGFIEWADNNNLPLAFFMKPGHATLLLRGPFIDSDNKWKISIFDPIHGGDEDIEVHPAQAFDEFKNSQLNEMAQYLDANSNTYIMPSPQGTQSFQINSYRLDANKIDSYLFDLWIRQPGFLPQNSGNIMPNTNSYNLLSKGSYDLTVPQFSGLPQNIIDSKAVRMQFDGKNCVPLSFFAGALRYAALAGNNEFKRTGLKQFEEDFGVRIHTREEILQLLK